MPLTKKEITLISLIVIGVVSGGLVVNIAGADEKGLPDFGPKPETSESEIEDFARTGDTGIDKADASKPSQRQKPAKPSGRVNINTAGESELTRLSGVGPALAKRICDDRAANGSFKSIDDLQRVKGIGPATVEKNRDVITIGN